MDKVANGITPYPYNHKNWLRNVEYWKTHPISKSRGDITEEMIDSLVESRIKERGINANIQNNQLPKDNRGVSRPDKPPSGKTK
jgi:hypothetical protein